MQVHNIPRNTKGEGRLLYIFTPKALVITAIFAIIGIVIFCPISVVIWNTAVYGMIVAAVLGLIGFGISSLKIPNSNNFELTRKAGGEYIDEIIKRYIKFKRKNNKIYVYYTKDEKSQ